MFDRLKLILPVAAVVLLWAAMAGSPAHAQACGAGGCAPPTSNCGNCVTPPPADDCNCDTGQDGRRRFGRNFGGGFGGGGGGGSGSGGSGSGGQGGSGGSVDGSFSSDVVTTVVNSVVTSVSGNGNGNGAGSGGTGSFSGSLFNNSAAFGLSGVINGSSSFGGGGSSFYVDSQTGYIPNLEVYDASAAASAQVAYQAERTAFRTVAIQAFCLDDKSIPHAASQVSPDRDVAESFEGELYRCLAGTRLQYILAAYEGKASFDKGQTIVCNKDDALYHSAGGKVACRRQKPSRDCNERSLLRRFGAGIKVLKMAYTETYTAYRTETAQASASASVVGSMILDGGVGGVVH